MPDAGGFSPDIARLDVATVGAAEPVTGGVALPSSSRLMSRQALGVVRRVAVRARLIRL